MTYALALVVVATACGRVGFGARTDGAFDLDGGGDASDPDAQGVDGGCMEDWGPITPLANLSVPGADDWEPAVTADELMIVFASGRGGGVQGVYGSRRATPDADFPAPTRLFTSATPL